MAAATKSEDNDGKNNSADSERTFRTKLQDLPPRLARLTGAQIRGEFAAIVTPPRAFL